MLDNLNLRINHIIKNYDKLLWRNKHITGFGRGLKQTNGKTTPKPCLTIFVEKKIPRNNLDRFNLIPKKINGVYTDVIESKKLTMRYGERLPARHGSIIGNMHTKSFGTLGCVVTDKDTKSNLYILSCNHVLCRAFNKSIGDKILYPPKLITEEEGISEIATLHKICPVNFSGKINEIDAALALVGKNTEYNRRNLVNIETTFKKKIISPEDLKFGQSISKKGCVTDITSGKLLFFNTTREVNLGSSSTGVKTALFSDMIISDILVEDGDSGSIGVVNDSNQPFGMAFVGNDMVAAFCSIKKIFSYFYVEFSM